jgi:hypothetical protein
MAILFTSPWLFERYIDPRLGLIPLLLKVTLSLGKVTELPEV